MKKKFGGRQPGAGRPKGSKDKLSRDIKKRVLDVWDKLEKGGKSLHVEAKNDPKWFYSNFVKPMLPKDVVLAGDKDNPIETKWTVEIIKAEKGA